MKRKPGLTQVRDNCSGNFLLSTSKLRIDAGKTVNGIEKYRKAKTIIAGSKHGFVNLEISPIYSFRELLILRNIMYWSIRSSSFNYFGGILIYVTGNLINSIASTDPIVKRFGRFVHNRFLKFSDLLHFGIGELGSSQSLPSIPIIHLLEGWWIVV
jgi:hypothetical protein